MQISCHGWKRDDGDMILLIPSERSDTVTQRYAMVMKLRDMLFGVDVPSIGHIDSGSGKHGHRDPGSPGAKLRIPLDPPLISRVFPSIRGHHVFYPRLSVVVQCESAACDLSPKSNGQRQCLAVRIRSQMMLNQRELTGKYCRIGSGGSIVRNILR